VKLSSITLDNTQDGASSSLDYPHTYAVYGSTDGVAFAATPFVSGSGAAKSTVINFAPETVRAVRIKNTASVSGIWWSIGEFKTTCSL